MRDATRAIRRNRGALWTRGVTPADGVPSYCTSHASPGGLPLQSIHPSPRDAATQALERKAGAMSHPLRFAVAIAMAVSFVGIVAPGSPTPADTAWTWPVTPVQVSRPFTAPATPYGAGHRGVDLAAVGAVRSPADGVVAFAGAVVDRGVLTIDHGGGLVTTFEPVETTLRSGDVVAGGQDVADVAAGGHAEPDTVHFGVRLNGDYINPLLLLGGVPRAVLLPCC